MPTNIQNRAVSPVIAVILMVAITVILSAVIGSFVLDIGSSLSESPPNAQFDFEQNNVDVRVQDSSGLSGNPVYPTYLVINITHVGGEPIEKSNIRVTVDGVQAYAVFDRGTSNHWTSSMPFEAFAKPDEPVTAGDQTTLLARVDADSNSGWNAEDLVVIGSPSHSHYYGNENQLTMGNSDGNNPSNVQIQPGETVQIVWDPGSGTSTILAEYEVKEDS